MLSIPFDDSPDPSVDLLGWAEAVGRGGEWQRTLERATPWLGGREPHSGQPVHLRLLPAPAGTGVVFTTDRAFAQRPAGAGGAAPNPRQSFPASLATARSIDVCIGVGRPGPVLNPLVSNVAPAAWITHIEHLCALLCALGVDNVYVAVSKETFSRDLIDKRAVPILASCTLGFARAVRGAGVVDQVGSRRRQRTLRTTFEDIDPQRGDRILATPAADPRGPLEIVYHAGYPGLGVEDRSLTLCLQPPAFLRTVGGARTMLGQLNGLPLTLARLVGFFSHATYGLGLGVDECNTMAPIRGQVVGSPRFGSPGEELVRHKIVDFLGAVALLGPLAGIRFEVTKSGHVNDLRALRRLEPQLVAVE